VPISDHIAAAIGPGFEESTGRTEESVVCQSDNPS